MNLRNFILRLIINAIAISVTAIVLPGISVTQEFLPLLFVALVFSVVNSMIKPILVLLSCPAVILTLGLFILVINGVVLQISGYFAGDLLTVDGFWTAVFGGVIIAITNMVLEGITGLEDEHKQSGGKKKK